MVPDDCRQRMSLSAAGAVVVGPSIRSRPTTAGERCGGDDRAGAAPDDCASVAAGPAAPLPLLLARFPTRGGCCPRRPRAGSGPRTPVSSGWAPSTRIRSLQGEVNMKPSPRSAVRNDVLADYEAPSPDLVVRVLRAIPHNPARPAAHRGRVVMQTAAVIMAALAIGIATIGVRVARGEMALPAGLPFGVGGLHPPAASYFIADAQFISADTAWIIAQLHEHNGPTVLMNTVDGGKTWHEQFRIPDGSGLGSFRFWNSKDGELSVLVPSTLPPSKTPGAPGSSNTVEQTYRSQDGGAHWQLLDRPIDWGNPAQGGRAL